MPDFEETILVGSGGELCPNCGEAILPANVECPACDYELASNPPEGATSTQVLRRKPNVTPKSPAESDYFGSDMMLILQVLPSGTCLPSAMSNPVVLGRQHPGDSRDLCDLTEFQANQHGVSRQHCELRRYGEQLLVTDLSSSNGTYLNGHPLTPGESQVVAHDDKLILGTLHLVVTFMVQ